MSADRAVAVPGEATPVLEIRGLRLAFQGEHRQTVALDGIDLAIRARRSGSWARRAAARR